MRPATTEPPEHATGLKLKFREQLFTPFTVSFSTRDNRTRSAALSRRSACHYVAWVWAITSLIHSVVDAGQRGSRNLHVVVGEGGVRTSCHAPLRLARQSTAPVLLLYYCQEIIIFTIDPSLHIIKETRCKSHVCLFTLNHAKTTSPIGLNISIAVADINLV